MNLNKEQLAAQSEFKSFVDDHLTPYAEEYDRNEEIPRALIRTIAERGYLGAMAPKEYGGKAMDALTWGLLCKEISRGCTSLASLLTVHSMTIQALAKWGSDNQRSTWLPKLATGESIAGFALTEPEVGSDARNVCTKAIVEGDSYSISGKKRWISFGQMADLFLVFAQIENKPCAFLVERGTDGFDSVAIGGMLGFRSAMLAELHMDKCHVPAGNLVGSIGFGFSHVAGTALEHGRFCIAYSALGILEGCLNACMEYADTRQQFGSPLRDHQLIQKMITEMIVQTKASRLMCHHAAFLKDSGDPSLIMETSTAKYFVSRAAVVAALDAVQIHGANGCSDQYPVARYLRDAKILEIIEGSTQMQQMIISSLGYQEYRSAKWQQ